jgi:drug/metabolite transporter (DMT)-like permease
LFSALLLVQSRGGDVNMKPISWVGIVLIVLGALALAYQGINYTRQKKVLDVGSVHLTTETHERIPLPPILGGLALAGGVVLLVMGAGNKS